MDNTTAIACINKMGTSHSCEANELTKQIWFFCLERNIWLSAVFIPGKLNKEADALSRDKNLDAEWCLKRDIFVKALKFLKVMPVIDLFASRLNYQIDKYASFRPDPEAFCVDAFSICWNETFYAFPPFCIISRVLEKVKREGANGVIVVPDWPSQTWFYALQELIVGQPILVTEQETMLYLPQKREEVHRLKKLRLIICHVSGVDSRGKDSQEQPQRLYVPLGGSEHGKDTPRLLESGKNILVRGNWIQFHLL